MTHADKLKQMYEHLPALGISPYTAAPPVYRLLWRLGVEVPPPLFTRFFPLALVMGAFFAIGWGGFMWLFFWSRESAPAGGIAVVSLAAGILFGLFMAGYIRYKANKLNLPLWSQYNGQQL